MLVDSHAHLNFPELLADIDGVLARAREAGVEKIINIGTSLEDSEMAIKLAREHEGLWATVGIHPNDDEGTTVESIDWQEFEKLARQPKIIAIGETGLDFSRGQDKKRQIKLFQKQIGVAKRLNLPLSIHIRDGQKDLMKMNLSGTGGVFHCFSGDQKYLEFVLGLGFYISFAGNVTFKNAQQLRELVKLVPLSRLLIETDCPFLAPEPHRGMRNEPANVKIIAQTLADLYSMSLEKLSEATTANATRLFKI